MSRTSFQKQFLEVEMKFQIMLLLMVFVSACAAQPGTPDEPGSPPPDTAVTSPPVNEIPPEGPHVNPFSPKPSDEQLSRGDVFISEKSLVIRESYPPQISLSLKGELPTPCHELRAEVAPPDAENKIQIEAYSVVDPNAVCTQVVEPLEESIDLGTFPPGHYSIWVNGEVAGEFDS
jgi:hypothetical protein